MTLDLPQIHFMGLFLWLPVRVTFGKTRIYNWGDWIVGLGSKSMGNLHHIVFAMKVEEKLTFDQYWNDARFQCKKPNLNGSLIEIYGDNVYHTDESTGKVIQEELCPQQDNGISG